MSNIREMLDKIKCDVEMNYFNRQTILKTLNNYEKMTTSNYVIYHKGYGSYCNDEKTPIKRLSIYWLFNIFKSDPLCRVHHQHSMARRVY